MSSDLLLDETAPLAWREPGHERFVWRGTLAAGMLREFLGDVAWGALDVLLVDMPPGSERLDTLVELVPGLAGAVVVTIPSDASYRAARRGVEAARAARRCAAGRGREHGGLQLRELSCGRATFRG